MNFSIQSLLNWYRNTLRNPRYRWWVVLGTLAYLLSPIDLVPDFLPIAGQIDDLAILTLLVSEVSQVLIDRVKSRKVADATAAEANQNDPVDVKAVPVE